MTMLELNWQRRRAKAEATEMLDRAVIDARNLSVAEQVRFDALSARIHELDASIAERESLRKLAR